MSTDDDSASMQKELDGHLESCMRTRANRWGWLLTRSSKRPGESPRRYHLTDREGRAVSGDSELSLEQVVMRLKQAT